MTCFQCGEDRLAVYPIQLKGIRNGEEYTVTTPGYRCESCGFETIDGDQSVAFTQAVSDAYRRAHDLLTGEEIRNRRLLWALSQQEFADYLKVGVASIKRWENGQIQDKAMDELIRVKTDIEYALQNVASIRLALPEQQEMFPDTGSYRISFAGAAVAFEEPSAIVLEFETPYIIGLEPDSSAVWSNQRLDIDRVAA